MVKKLNLAESTEQLQDKAENVRIDEKSDEKQLLRYVKAAATVFANAESVMMKGDEEQAYIYFVKYFHVYSQLRSTTAYINKNKAVLNEMNKLLPITKCKKALDNAEKLKKSLDDRYAKQKAATLQAATAAEEVKRLEEERVRELEELERLRIEAAQPALDAATIFSQANSIFASPLLPLGQSPKDTISKEPYISSIELMHIMEAKMTVLLIDIRTLDEFKNSHIIHESVIFISKDYLDISTKLTSSEIRELILMKDHKKLWDKRNSFDLILIFDTDSQYQTVAELQTHPINIVRECTTDCLDPNFMNTDLPKVLDGGYGSWVYHFPKHCTNPDRARRARPTKTKIRKSAVSSLPLSPPKSAAIYPELNNTEPKVLPLPTSLPTSLPASVVTCGNVQINMQQIPQTIQINQYNQDKESSQPSMIPQPTHVPLSVLPTSHVQPSVLPTSHVQPSVPPTSHVLPSVPPTSHVQPSVPQPSVPCSTVSPPNLPPRLNGPESHAPSHPPVQQHAPSHPPVQQTSRGGLKITDVYEGASIKPTAHSSNHQPSIVREETMTTFPSKPAPDPIYAQVESRKKGVGTPVAAVQPKVTEYADIRSIRASATVPAPSVDRSKKPSTGAAPALPSHTPPKAPLTTVQQPRPAQPVAQHSQPRPAQPVAQHSPRDRPGPTSPRSNPMSPPLRNPTVNRVVKPLSAKAVEEKYLRMMPAFGSVQQGTCGLKNIGNTCFMNAVLQCLSAVAPLTHYFTAGNYKQEINPDNILGTKGLVAEEYAFLIKAMWSDRFRHLAPKDWKEAIGRFRPQFLDYSQKDSQEFTSFMLDALHEDLNRVTVRPKNQEIDYSKFDTYNAGAAAAWESYVSRNDSVIVDLFQGQFRNITCCMRCGYKSVTFDTFMYLTVPVSKSRTSLQSCIETFCQTERIEWRCDKCKVLGDASKGITIWRLPHILVVILKRFSYSGVWRDKISTFVDFPLSNFGATPSWVSNPAEKKSYRLFGVTNHTGTLEGGHYIGCARNPASGDWFTFDDHVIRPMKAEQTRKKEAYLLFYTSLSEQEDLSWIRKRRDG